MSQTEIEMDPIRVTFHPKASLEGSKPPMVTHANLTEACSKLGWFWKMHTLFTHGDRAPSSFLTPAGTQGNHLQREL